jgi:predicted glutamine amidotransferase
MCRLLGVVSRAPMSLTDSLDGQFGPFAELSGEHPDGWGVASWQDGRLAVAKGAARADASPGFQAAADGVSDAAILHIRQASPGLPNAVGNTHPFAAGTASGTVAFAHNGYFTPADALDELIGSGMLASAGGTTDSERYFLRVLTLLAEHGPVGAIARAADDIRTRAEFASLNCLLLTPDALYAYSEEDPASEVSRRRGPDFFRLRYRVAANRVVVASSGIPQPAPEWGLLPYHQVLEIRRGDLDVQTHPVPGSVPAGTDHQK